MLVLNTPEAGQEIDTAGRDVIADHDIRVVDVNYPFPEYQWWTHFCSEAGWHFEREVITKARSFVDDWRGL